MKPPKDCYGSLIVVGATVAFNYSGMVRVGRLKEIVPYVRYGKTQDEYTKEPYLKFKIEHIDSKAITVVTNKDNLVVIGDPP